jgi:uncharacterized membrane protein YdjX (TVP38/TMEM64 family)
MLAIPAVPLAASAGYLFGVTKGTLVVLLSATIAAGGAFMIGRLALRQWWVVNVCVYVCAYGRAHTQEAVVDEDLCMKCVSVCVCV